MKRKDVGRICFQTYDFSKQIVSSMKNSMTIKLDEVRDEPETSRVLRDKEELLLSLCCDVLRRKKFILEKEIILRKV